MHNPSPHETRNNTHIVCVCVCIDGGCLSRANVDVLLKGSRGVTAAGWVWLTDNVMGHTNCLILSYIRLLILLSCNEWNISYLCSRKLLNLYTDRRLKEKYGLIKWKLCLPGLILRELIGKIEFEPSTLTSQTPRYRCFFVFHNNGWQWVWIWTLWALFFT